MELLKRIVTSKLGGGGLSLGGGRLGGGGLSVGGGKLGKLGGGGLSVRWSCVPKVVCWLFVIWPIDRQEVQFYTAKITHIKLKSPASFSP
jgi:hypothetical protein